MHLTENPMVLISSERILNIQPIVKIQIPNITARGAAYMIIFT